LGHVLPFASLALGVEVCCLFPGFESGSQVSSRIPFGLSVGRERMFAGCSSRCLVTPEVVSTTYFAAAFDRLTPDAAEVPPFPPRRVFAARRSICRSHFFLQRVPRSGAWLPSPTALFQIVYGEQGVGISRYRRVDRCSSTTNINGEFSEVHEEGLNVRAIPCRALSTDRVTTTLRDFRQHVSDTPHRWGCWIAILHEPSRRPRSSSAPRRTVRPMLADVADHFEFLPPIGSP